MKQFREHIHKKLDFKDKFKSITAEEEREMKLKRLKEEKEKKEKMKEVAKKKGQIYTTVSLRELI